LEPDETQAVRDLLGDAKQAVDQLEADARQRYLDGAWRFASRFATLILERQVRKELAQAGWLLLDFDQTRSHRPDFFAVRDDVWLLIATRVEPKETEKTRKRLSGQSAPWGAERVVVYPGLLKAEAREVENEFANVELLAFSEIDDYVARIREPVS
jgi:hypothetical protein